MSNWYNSGSFTQSWVEIDDDDYETQRQEDVTSKVQALGRKAVKLTSKVTALQKDLSDIKNRRYWEDVELFYDKNTGMVAAIRTTYRWQAETMRLDFTPDMISALSFNKN